MKQLRAIITSFLLSVYICSTTAQNNNALLFQPQTTDTSNSKKPDFFQSRFYRITHIAVPLIAIGSIASAKDKDFSNMRNSYIPRFRFHYDDYLQYSPGLLMLGLKTAGVEGRSSWGRMLASDAIAAGIMGLTVNTLKQSVHKVRPDQSNNNSFPSGHTATAFMLATMLHKEYGQTRSPMYSIAGYSLATATALSRQLNNKHWFSDVLTGAGIGILSTELGYYFVDLIFKDKGIIRQPKQGAIHSDRYSFFGIQMGYGVGEREVHLPEGIELEGKGGVMSSLNGGWLFTPHWGVTGKFSLTQVTPQLKADQYFDRHPEMEGSIQGMEVRSMTYANLTAGIMYNHEIANRLYVGGSVMPGIGWTGTYRVNVKYKGEAENTPLIHCQTHPIANLDFSAYLMHSMDKNLGFKIFINYNMGRGRGNYTYYSPSTEKPVLTNGHTNLYLHHFSIGAEVDALLWK